MTIDDNDIVLIVCHRWFPGAVPGSITLHCHGCDWPIVLSLSGQALLERIPDAKLLCDGCASRNIAMVPAHETEFHELPGMRDEMRAAGFSDATITDMHEWHKRRVSRGTS